MKSDYHLSVFPVPCRKAHVRRNDLRAFRNIGLDKIESASHLAQLRLGAKTVGLATLLVYPKYREVHINYAEIIEEMRGNRLNQKLLTGVFDYAAALAELEQDNVEIVVGGFTPKGQRSNLPTLERLAVTYTSKHVILINPAL